MGSQMSFGDLESQGQRRKTRREEFLERMDAIVPGTVVWRSVGPSYHSGARGRHVRGARRCSGCTCSSDVRPFRRGHRGCRPDSRAMQRFMHLDLMQEQVPDATTLAKFRHVLEREGLGRAILRDLDAQLEEADHDAGGSIVDATFIEAPSSTKNRPRTRSRGAPVQEGQELAFLGYKAHIGVDAGSGLVHTVETTAANVSDVSMAHALVREDDAFCYADSATRAWRSAPKSPPIPTSSMRWTVARKPSTIKGPGLHAFGREGHRIREGIRPLQGGASLPHREAPVRASEDALQGDREEFLHALRILRPLANLAMCISAGRSLASRPEAA